MNFQIDAKPVCPQGCNKLLSRSHTSFAFWWTGIICIVISVLQLTCTVKKRTKAEITEGCAGPATYPLFYFPDKPDHKLCLFHGWTIHSGVSEPGLPLDTRLCLPPAPVLTPATAPLSPVASSLLWWVSDHSQLCKNKLFCLLSEKKKKRRHF